MSLTRWSSELRRRAIYMMSSGSVDSNHCVNVNVFHTLLTEKSASLHPVRRSHLPKLTPWRPSKRCNPAIRRGVLKKSPKGLVAHSDWAGPCSEKQPAAPSLDELWNCICSGKHVGRRVGNPRGVAVNLSRALTFPCSCASVVSPWYG